MSAPVRPSSFFPLAVRAALPAVALALALVSAPGSPAAAYPLDGYEETGIARLLHQRGIQEGEITGPKRPSGELLPLARVQLRLLDRPEFTLPEPDPTMTRRLRQLLGPQADRYGMSLLDLSDLENPVYAEVNGNQKQNPGSVGKLVVALGIFQALADLHPDDIEARKKLLRETVVVADDFSVYDHHTVRFFDPETRTLTRHPLRKGDRATLWTYLDWMISPSSNSAAGMLQKQLILMAHFGKAYPPTPEQEKEFFATTSKTELAKVFEQAIQEPLTRNGLDVSQLRQGSFLTREGKKRVPGTSSYATPRELLKFCVLMEQGKLVDTWSSREIKRLMYVTERRIRYGSAGILRDSAVYFKSGSLYSCKEEEGFQCGKYRGNRRNYMNSVAIVESPAGQDRLFYMATVLSNVLRRNSAQDHRDLARAVHQMLLAKHPAEPGSKRDYGEGFIGYESERAEMQLKVDTQEALLDLGYDIGDIDGLIGPATRKAIRDFQAENGLPVNGTPSRALVDAMRESARARGLARPGPAASAPATP